MKTKHLLLLAALMLPLLGVSAQDIYGIWTPVENSAYELNISRYGTFKSSEDSSEDSYLFALKDGIVTLRTDGGFKRGEMRVVVTGEGDSRTLEIYDNTRYAGRYVVKKAADSERQITCGAGFSLAGRTAQALPSPVSSNDKEGKVVVKIWVDREGNVTQVSAPEKGSTLTDQAYVNQSKTAAMQTKFSANANAPEPQTGTITYVFRNN